MGVCVVVGGPCWCAGAGCAGRKNNNRRGSADLPVVLARLVLRLRLRLALKLRTLGLGLAVTRLLVDVHLLARRLLLLGAAALFLVDADLFLDVLLARRLLLLLVRVDGGREGFVRLFVPFPSVCLRLR